MRYCGMKHPAFVKLRLPGKEKDQIKHKWVIGDFDDKGNFTERPILEIGLYFVKDRSKRFNRGTRPFKIQPKTPVRGYRVDKPEFKDSFFFPTYSRAVDILLMGFRGKGKIEAVR